MCRHCGEVYTDGRDHCKPCCALPSGTIVEDPTENKSRYPSTRGPPKKRTLRAMMMGKRKKAHEDDDEEEEEEDDDDEEEEDENDEGEEEEDMRNEITRFKHP
eukprot:4107012-Pyramimonas_sp.AAC.1